MKNKKTKCTWHISEGTMSADFSIYQSSKGGIWLMIGDNAVELSLQQVNDLRLDVYSLVDFDYELFKERYFTSVQKRIF